MGLSADDHNEINNLLGRYNFAIDYGTSGDWADCFADGATFDAGQGDPPISGRDALVEFCDLTKQFVPDIRHMLSNVVIDGSGDDASIKAYVTVTNGTGAAVSILTTGYYDDTAVRTADGWRFSSRKLVPDG